MSPRILLRRGIGVQSVVAGLKDDRLEAYPTVRIPGLTPPGSPETVAEGEVTPLHVAILVNKLCGHWRAGRPLRLDRAGLFTSTKRKS